MITSFSNQRVKEVVSLLNKAKERKKTGYYVVEGKKMFEEAPKELIQEVYISEDYLIEESKKEIQEKLKSIRYEIVSKEVFQKMSDTQTPQGILCIMKQQTYLLEDYLKKENPLFVVLEDLQDPGNLGTILRTAEGAGITGVILSMDTVDIYNPKTIRATMGSIYRVPFFRVDSIQDTLELFKGVSINSYAAHLSGETFYNHYDFRKPTAFLIGNEGNGLRKETADRADYYLKIPMEGKVESLNASIATALLMYEAHRQRT